MKKRIIFGLLAVVLSASLLVACGNGAQANNAPAQGGAEQAAQQEPVAAQDSPYAIPAEPIVPDQQVAPDQANAGAATISEQDALHIALQHAGVSESDVMSTYSHLKFEDDYGKQIYEINFYVDKMEYDYDIDAATGDILSYESEYDD